VSEENAKNVEGAGEEVTYEVLVMETEEGETEEWVLLDRQEVKGDSYVLIALVEDIQYLEELTEEEAEKFIQEEQPYMVMRENGSEFEEISEEAFESISDELQQKFFGNPIED
jgi:hypothetical protein